MTNTPANQNEDEDPGRWSEFEDAVERREELYQSGSTTFWELPILARLWLEELRDVSLTPLDPDSQAPKKQAERHGPERNPPESDAHPVRLENGKMLWLKLDGVRTERGYKSVRVSDEPLRTDAAIVAALAVLEAAAVDEKRLDFEIKRLSALLRSHSDTPLKGPLTERVAQIAKQLGGSESRNADLQFLQKKLHLCFFEFVLGAEDVAGLVGVKESTVWRWCRDGKLPCLKLGKHWRVRQGTLEDFLKGSERPVTLAGQLDSFLQEPDSVLAIAQDIDLLHRLDAAFFQVGQTRGGLLVKFYAGEEYSEDQLLASFEENGLEASRLKREDRLLMSPEGEPLGGSRGEQLGWILEEESGKRRTVWASFNWVKPVDLETALEQQGRLGVLADGRQLVVKTAALEEALSEWPSSQLRRVQAAHSAIILASEGGLSLSRATPMPPS